MLRNSALIALEQILSFRIAADMMAAYCTMWLMLPSLPHPSKGTSPGELIWCFKHVPEGKEVDSTQLKAEGS